MYKSLILFCAVCLVIIEARPRWQYLPEVPGYVPVYIRNGDTPLEEINPELAEAFHALPAGRSAGKQLEAAAESPDHPEQADQPQPEPEPFDVINKQPHEKISPAKKSDSEIIKPEERR
ncbi:uncharacterized protein [Epargyreus clarus]|uniref:uncharacterized protein n=1 Tax=Epargyreus clarus TaxID=520877 RepID=UPI003C2CE984